MCGRYTLTFEQVQELKDFFGWLDQPSISQANEVMIQMRGLTKNEELSTILVINYNHIKQ